MRVCVCVNTTQLWYKSPNRLPAACKRQCSRRCVMIWNVARRSTNTLYKMRWLMRSDQRPSSDRIDFLVVVVVVVVSAPRYDKTRRRLIVNARGWWINNVWWKKRDFQYAESFRVTTVSENLDIPSITIFSTGFGQIPPNVGKSPDVSRNVGDNSNGMRPVTNFVKTRYVSWNYARQPLSPPNGRTMARPAAAVSRSTPPVVNQKKKKPTTIPSFTELIRYLYRRRNSVKNAAHEKRY